ncbi:MAG: GspH/FimT family protein [Planctomycetes bacterium]|nr:GspH/FimT family protein [Planctomycetota bacterium]
MRIPRFRVVRGMTLIEIAFILVIVAVLAVTGAVKIGESAALRDLDAAASQLRALLREAQARAVAENRAWRVTFDTALDRATLEVDAGGGSFTAQETVVLPRHARIDSTTFPSDRVDFDGSGGPSAGGQALLSIARGGAKTVTVVAGTGIVKIQ